MAETSSADPAVAEELEERFGKLSSDMVFEFDSMLRLYQIDVQELYFKWESYCMKMGSEDTKLNLDTVRAFRKDTHDQFESQSKAQAKRMQASASAKPAQRTPRNITSTGDMFGMLDGVVPVTPRAAPKPGSAARSATRHPHETPRGSTIKPPPLFSSPMGGSGPTSSFTSTLEAATQFRERKNAGQILETLNDHIPEPVLPSEFAGDPEKRVELTINVDMPKFSYRPMYQKLTEASEYLDDRIDDYATLIQSEHDIPDEEFGNPANNSSEETVVVGRIVCDSLDGKLNLESVLLESSRRMGAGARVPLKLDDIPSASFFPGMLVAFKGVNPSGAYFAVKKILDPPRLTAAATAIEVLESFSQRQSASNMDVVVAAGPYTSNSNLDFEALDELCDKVAETCPDILILLGPFIDIEHPKVAMGDFTLESAPEPGMTGTLEALFRERITPKISKITKTTILMLPSTKDAVSKHVAFPQEPFQRKPLQLPKNVKLLTNPCIFSLNDVVFGASSADIMFHIMKEETNKNPSEVNALIRVARHVITQRHFYPLYPPPAKTSINPGPSMPVDVPQLKLCEFGNILPDVLILPGQAKSFAKIVDSVVTINPGHLSKAMAPNTYATISILPPDVDTMDRDELLVHKVYNRARVDIKKI